jgi:hypothetical protein
MDPFTTGAFVIALLTVGVLPRFARSQNHRESQGVALLVWAFLHFLQPLYRNGRKKSRKKEQ